MSTRSKDVQKERKHSSSFPGDRDPDDPSEGVKAREVQPGTAEAGKSWQSRSPVLNDDDDKLHQALKDSFPASDPPAQPKVTGWDLTEEEKKKQKSAT